MHLTRANTTRKLPIARKGTQYVARPLSHLNDSVTVLAAIRDMLHLAKTAKEVNEMIKSKLIKINSRIVRDYHEPVCLFSFLEADKKYKLILLPTGRFSLEETKDKARMAKIVGKKMLNHGKIQLNLHDGTNVLIGKEEANVGDSIELDSENKIKKVVHFEKGKEVFVKSGKNMGQTGKVSHVEKNNINVNLGEKAVALKKEQLIVL